MISSAAIGYAYLIILYVIWLCPSAMFELVKNKASVRLANSKARIKPTAPLSAFDKENSIEFPLDSLHYLYNYYMVCALLSHAYHVTSCDVML